MAGKGKSKKAKKTKFDATVVSDVDGDDDDDLIDRIRQGPAADQSPSVDAVDSAGEGMSPSLADVDSPRGAAASSPDVARSSALPRAIADSDSDDKDNAPQPSKRRRVVVDSDDD